MLEAHMNLKELKAIIQVNKKPQKEKFLNQSLFEGKKSIKSTALGPHDFKEIKSHMILRKFKAQIRKT